MGNGLRNACDSLPMRIRSSGLGRDSIEDKYTDPSF